MKITQEQLRKLILEETLQVLQEQEGTIQHRGGSEVHFEADRGDVATLESISDLTSVVSRNTDLIAALAKVVTEVIGAVSALHPASKAELIYGEKTETPEQKILNKLSNLESMLKSVIAVPRSGIGVGKH